MKQIEIDGRIYSVNLEKAINDGYLEPEPTYDNVNIGDVYRFLDHKWCPVVILSAGWHTDKYMFGGFGKQVLEPYSTSPMTMSEIKKYLTDHGAVFIKNINVSIDSL